MNKEKKDLIGVLFGLGLMTFGGVFLSLKGLNESSKLNIFCGGFVLGLSIGFFIDILLIETSKYKINHRREKNEPGNRKNTIN